MQRYGAGEDEDVKVWKSAEGEDLPEIVLSLASFYSSRRPEACESIPFFWVN